MALEPFDFEGFESRKTNLWLVVEHDQIGPRATNVQHQLERRPASLAVRAASVVGVVRADALAPGRPSSLSATSTVLHTRCSNGPNRLDRWRSSPPTLGERRLEDRVSTTADVQGSPTRDSSGVACPSESSPDSDSRQPTGVGLDSLGTQILRIGAPSRGPRQTDTCAWVI